MRTDSGRQVVISGMSGVFPDANNVYELRDKLFAGEDLVTDDERRWIAEHPEVPQRTGKLCDLRHFDASFFGVTSKQGQAMDPMCRNLLERAYEAVADAGVNPRQLRGRNVGVFVAAAISESEKTWFYDKLQANGMGLTGCSRAMFANRISYWLGTHGPSYLMDTGCSSGLSALEHAYRALQDGTCDSAIVGAANLCLHPYVSLQFSRLGVLSPEGKCRCFDNDANGFARSEAVVVMYLQWASEAHRVYATIEHMRCSFEGFRNEFAREPSLPMQEQLLREFYAESGHDPRTVEYLEASAHGIRSWDATELEAVSRVFCQDRDTPLRIGCVKSNMGHTEPVSGLCGLAKVLIAMETGCIPPNLHYNNPNEAVDALKQGQLEVVTEKCAFNGGLVAVNSFSLAGSDVHLLLRWNDKVKVNNGAPTDRIPRLVIASGRTEEAVDYILKELESKPLDAEFVQLIQDLHSTDIPGHTYRGYSVITQDDKRLRSVKHYQGSRRPVWYVFTGMGSQWTGMGKAFLSIPIFAAAIDKCQRALQPYGVDVHHIITTDDPTIFDNILNCFVGIAACQIGLVDIMNAVGIEADGIVGHSVGELGCSYMDGCFTAEQMVLAAYFRGRASIETELIDGLMAAVGLGAKEMKKLCPPDIEVACHNGPAFCTLSGPTESMKTFVKSLQQRGVFAKEVNCANIAYHSKYIAGAGPALLKYLKQVIPNPKPRSPLWVSSSVPESEWDTPLAKLSSAEYHTNNLLGSVLFEDACKHIPNNAITIEIAPHGLLQAILKRSLDKNIINIAVTQRGHPNGTEVLFSALGRLYELGLQPQLTRLYPQIEYPVSRGTPMLSPLVQWEHSEDFFVMIYKQAKGKASERHLTVSWEDKSKQFLSGSVIDGRNVFPAMGFIEIVWETFALVTDQVYTDFPVVFENVRFHRPVDIPKQGDLELGVMVQKGSGRFEVTHSGSLVVSGVVLTSDKISQQLAVLQPLNQDGSELSSQDVYRELSLRGYNYEGQFQSIASLHARGQSGKVHWKNNWTTFLDSLLQIHFLQDNRRNLRVPLSIQRLTIDAKQQTSPDYKKMDEVVEVSVYNELGIIRAGLVEVRGLKTVCIDRHPLAGQIVLEERVFVPYEEYASLDYWTALRACLHIVLENQQGSVLKIVELNQNGLKPISPQVELLLRDVPNTEVDLTLLGSENCLPDRGSSVKVKDHQLTAEKDCTLIMSSSILQHADLLRTAVDVLSDGAYILAREKPDSKSPGFNDTPLEVVMEKTCEHEKLVLLKKAPALPTVDVVLVSAQNSNWLAQLHDSLARTTQHRIVLVAQREALSGIVGLVEYIRRQPGSNFVRCFFILDTLAPLFDINLPFYRKQLNKDLVMNVYNNGKWGSYRHMPMSSPPIIPVPHAYVSVRTRGDLSSLEWVEGRLHPVAVVAKPAEELVHVYNSGLNFRDVLTATKRLDIETAIGQPLQDGVEGMEFSGRNTRGHRVMGIVPSCALGSMVLAHKDLLWNVPNNWTLEDAATVPMAYATAYYALVLIGKMKKGESLLVHSGSGAVGQAAIRLALHTGCTVYTTVSSLQKREYIKQLFPQLEDSNIGSSQDISFEELVMSRTEGAGVDLVLNSLAEDKLQASLRCVAQRGRFLELGKADFFSNKVLGMDVFLKEVNFCGVSLINVFSSSEWRHKIQEALNEGILNGMVQPLPRTVFTDSEVQKAFRYLASPKHMGKVLIRIRPEENKKQVLPLPKMIPARPRFYCNPENSYVISGGIGVFGVELADWLVQQGARKLVLTSDVELTSYHNWRIGIWRSQGASVVSCTADTTSKSAIMAVLSKANDMGPVDAIFCLPKLVSLDLHTQSSPALILDVCSRHMCPHLRHFVAFCRRSAADGWSHSVMERVCEARDRDGFPALAVQWGALELEHDDLTEGVLLQSMSSCFEILGRFMRQSQVVMSSIVVAQKESRVVDIVECIRRFLGTGDLEAVDLNATLAELGIDSLMLEELKQLLDREHNTYVTTKGLASMSISQLQELVSTRDGKDDSTGNVTEGNLGDSPPLDDVQLLLNAFGPVSQPVVRMPSATGSGPDVESVLEAGPVLFMLPGLDGLARPLEPLALNLKFQTVCLQLDQDDELLTVEDIADHLLPFIQTRLPPSTPFTLLGYSFGGLLALELVRRLEAEGRTGCLYLLNSSPGWLRGLLADRDCDTKILCRLFGLLAPHLATSTVLSKLTEELAAQKTWSRKLGALLKMVPDNKQDVDLFSSAIHRRLKAIDKYEWTSKEVVQSPTILLRTSNVDEDFALSKCCEEVKVHCVAGTHAALLENKEVAAIINRQVTNIEDIKFKSSFEDQHFVY